jgi:eukaryotic-like serine/threonine-protein kinase
MSNASIGMQFGPYLLRQRLGVGGMASVWKAIDQQGRALVVKRILPSLASEADFVAMFDREATLSARMRHPNIVRVFDHGDYEGERYLAMEHLHGRDLSSAMIELTRRGTPAPGLGAFVGREMCRALDYVHTLADDDGAPLHLVHRDVSLSNVMLGFDGGVKLLDFGVAKALADEMTQRTQAGVLKGKWAYLAPEQVEGAAVSDQRADLFALGVVLWEMLTGRRLFKGATGLQTLEKVRAARVLPPSTINPAVPEALDGIVLKALARAPVDRWQSAAQMAAALDAEVPALGVGADELAQHMTSLFADDAAAFHQAQHATPPHGTALPAAPLAYDDSDTVPAPRVDLADTLDDAAPVARGEMLSPTGATLAALRRPERRWNRWRLLLAAALASLLGGFTGWQISHADGVVRTALTRVASR